MIVRLGGRHSGNSLGVLEPGDGKAVKEYSFWDFSGILVVKNPPSKAGDAGSIPGRAREPLHHNIEPAHTSN